MKKIIIILSAALCTLFFACSPVINNSFTANGSNSFSGGLPYKPHKNDVVQGFVIAKTADGFDKTFFENQGIEVYGKLSLAGTGFTYWYLHQDTSNDTLLQAVYAIKGILCADNDYKVTPPDGIKQSDFSSFGAGEPRISTQGLEQGNYLKDPISGKSAYSLDITKALQAYKDIGYGDKDVVAGIIDTGINMLHEDFKAGSESIVLYAKSAKTGPASSAPPIGDGDAFTEVPLNSNWDVDGHGTHCSGIMCALGDNDKGIAGVAWKKTKLISYQSLGFAGGGTTWAVYGALADLTNTIEILRKVPATRTAADKVKLPSYIQNTNFQITQKTVPVNMSLGSSIGSDFAFAVLTNAIAHDVLPVIAMGNEGRYTAAYPAAFPGVLAVGATNGKDKKARFSNRGSWISVAAPGESIISCGVSDVNSYVSLSGTSMAAPFVTGFVSYLLSFDNARNLTPYQIKTMIEKTADKVDGVSSFDERFGHGRVNVLKAAQAVKDNTVPATNDVYSEGTVTVHVIGLSSPIKESLCLIDKVLNIPLVYVPMNNSGKIPLKGLIKGKTYSVFISDGTKVKVQDFTAEISDQTVTINW